MLFVEKLGTNMNEDRSKTDESSIKEKNKYAFNVRVVSDLITSVKALISVMLIDSSGVVQEKYL